MHIKFKPMVPRGYKVHVRTTIETNGGWVVIFTQYYLAQGMAEERTAFVDAKGVIGWNMPNYVETKGR